MKKHVSFLALTLIFATALFAQELRPEGIIYPAGEKASEVLRPQGSTPAPGGSVLTGLFYIIFLAALGTVIWYFWKGRGGIGAGSASHCASRMKGLEIGQMRSLGSRQFLVVAKYRDKEMVLGVGPGFINKIETFEKEPQQQEDVCQKQPLA